MNSEPRRGSFARFACASLTAVLLGAGAALGQEAKEELRWYDVSALLAASGYDNEIVDARRQILYLDDLEPDEPFHGVESWWTESLESVLEEVLSADGKQEGLTIESYGTRLAIRTSPAQHTEVARVLAELEAYFLRPIEVEAFLISARDVPREVRAVLSADEVVALLASCRPLAQARTSTLPGKRARLIGTGVEAYLQDVDVESIFPAPGMDPQVNTLASGVELGVVARPSARGGWLVDVWGRQGTQKPPGRARFESFEPMELHLPRVSGTLAGASARLEDGEGVLVGQDWTTDGMWLVRVRGRELVESPVFVPVSALTAKPFVCYPNLFGTAQPSGGWHARGGATLDWWDLEPWPEAMSRRALIMELAAADPVAIAPGGGHLEHDLRLSADPEVARRLRERIASLEEQVAETVCVELRFGFVGTEVIDGLSRGRFGADWLAELLGHRAIGAARFGGSLGIFGGEHRLYLKEHDIEISQAAMGPDPIVDLLVEGFSFWCRPTPLLDGRIATLTELLWQEQVLVPQILPVCLYRGSGTYPPYDGPPLWGEIELASGSRVQNGNLLVLEPGEWELVACSTVPRVEGTLVAVLRLATR